MRSMSKRLAKVSAKDWTRQPASAAGAVAPDCGAITTQIGAFSSNDATATSQLSVPYCKGETIVQPPP